MRTKANTVNAVLSAVGEKFGYMDDSWPDMRDEMVVSLIDAFEIDEDVAEKLAAEFLENS